MANSLNSRISSKAYLKGAIETATRGGSQETLVNQAVVILALRSPSPTVTITNG